MSNVVSQENETKEKRNGHLFISTIKIGRAVVLSHLVLQ